jgi:hypothetical protein
MPTPAIPAEMPSCAASPTLPAEVSTQEQVIVARFIRTMKAKGNQITNFYANTSSSLQSLSWK